MGDSAVTSHSSMASATPKVSDLTQFVFVKLGALDYLAWVYQFPSLLQSNDLLGLIDGFNSSHPKFVDALARLAGTINPAFVLWKRRDAALSLVGLYLHWKNLWWLQCIAYALLRKPGSLWQGRKKSSTFSKPCMAADSSQPCTTQALSSTSHLAPGCSDCPYQTCGRENHHTLDYFRRYDYAFHG
ncbi:unnamed protein product [Fraxinus pennsylvanica]|uniref:Uncharacterized protein n=1 Tax=Fraxinus pennsylvanica TaxID=56036 RepID=A0AAD2E8R5_9LAMI|nr:unnamed protein product [Fraxinus pennsylvanica]